MKKIYLLLVFAFALLLSGCSEKTVKTIDLEEKTELFNYFCREYSKQFSYVNVLESWFLEPGHEYYDSETIRVDVKNKYTYYEEHGIFELSCYYDKEAKKWQYLGYQALTLDKKLNILGEWEFEIFPGFFSNASHYVGYMNIKEIRNNQALIAMRVNTGAGERIVEDQWVELYSSDANRLETERISSYSFITVPPAGKKGKSLKHSLIIYYDDIAVRSTDYYEVKKMNRLSTSTGNNTVTLNIHK